jgi:hypothetical protein
MNHGSNIPVYADYSRAEDDCRLASCIEVEQIACMTGSVKKKDQERIKSTN